MKQNLLIVRILGMVAVLAIVGAVALVVTGHTTEAAITGLVGIASGSVGQLGGVLRGAGREAQDESEGDK